MNVIRSAAARASAGFAGILVLVLAAGCGDAAGPDLSACGDADAPPQCPGPPGTFALLPELVLPIAVRGAIYRQIRQGDFNGDGRMDILFNMMNQSPAINRVQVAFGQSDGGFTTASQSNHMDNPIEGWPSFHLLIGDVNADDRDDLIWNSRISGNVIYVGLASADGGFDFRPRQEHTISGGWGGYLFEIGDMDGDGRDDVVWNSRTRSMNSTYIAFATGSNGAFATLFNRVDQPGDYSGYRPAVIGRFSGTSDGILLNAVTATQNDIRLGTITGNPPAFSITWTRSHDSGDWDAFNESVRTGDFDGALGDDLFWIHPFGSGTALRTAMNTGSASFEHTAAAQVAPIQDATPLLADFNGDARTDVLLNRTNAQTNSLIVGLGSADGFIFPNDVATYPIPSLAAGGVFVGRFAGDVNGDGRADMVWYGGEGVVLVYVALARRS